MRDTMFRHFKIRVAIIWALISNNYTWSYTDSTMYLWTKFDSRIEINK